MAAEDRDFTHSTLRERIVEHVFVGDVLRTLWRRGITDVEIVWPEFDAHGYDVVMSRGPTSQPASIAPDLASSVHHQKRRIHGAAPLSRIECSCLTCFSPQT